MESLPLFPGLFDAPAPSSGPRRARRGKVPFDIAAPSLREEPAAQGERYARADAALPDGGAALGVDGTPDRELELAVGSGALTETVMVTESVSMSLELVPPQLVPPQLVPPLQARRSEAGVLVFDVETTGTDRKRDQIIELCVQRGLSGTDYKVWRFKPTVPISDGAQKAHGISIEELADCPAFATCADEIAAWFASADVIVGYNVAFDVDMLQAEYERAGRAMLQLADKKVVDPFRLWQHCEPRSLVHAHQRFVGQGFEAAHSAAADVAATGRVLVGMLAAFGLDEHDWDGVATVCDPKRTSWVGPSRHLQWDGATVVLSFGKHQGVPLHVLATSEHSGYLRWVCDRDFPVHVGEICGRALELAGDTAAFLGWVRAQFGPPAAAAETPSPAPAPSPVAAPSPAAVSAPRAAVGLAVHG